MIIKYDNNLYYEMADKANELKQKLYILETEQEFERQVFEYEKKEIEVPIYDEETGEIIGYEKQLVDDLDRPIMVEEIDPDTGETILVHKYHLETYKDTVAELTIAETNYYICYKENYTDGTINPDFDKEEEEKRKQEEITELKLELDNLDLKTVRPLRAINNGTATDYDVEKLNALEQQAKEIRERIAELSNCII